MKLPNKKRMIVIGAAITAVGIIAAIAFAMKGDLARAAAYLVNQDTNPAGLLVLYTVLPIAGFPILPFLVLLGVKFGLKVGILIMLAGFFVHLTIAFYLTHQKKLDM
jgi:uncharacterized membrane protein YdjX (TVP38/TMEM64 family)